MSDIEPTPQAEVRPPQTYTVRCIVNLGENVGNIEQTARRIEAEDDAAAIAVFTANLRAEFGIDASEHINWVEEPVATLDTEEPPINPLTLLAPRDLNVIRRSLDRDKSALTHEEETLTKLLEKEADTRRRIFFLRKEVESMERMLPPEPVQMKLL